MARRFMMKHLTQVARVYTLPALTAAIRKFALLRERRIELFRDPAGERIIELERVGMRFSDHHTHTTHDARICSL